MVFFTFNASVVFVFGFEFCLVIVFICALFGLTFLDKVFETLVSESADKVISADIHVQEASVTIRMPSKSSTNNHQEY